MYSIKTESHFDSAHFLHGYEGKCSNIHGHHWRVSAQINRDELKERGDERGMIVDFGILKAALNHETEILDHTLIIEKGSLRENTLLALKDEGFKVVTLDFRPTAENLSKYFWDRLKEKGYELSLVEVYETPENCAAYYEADRDAV